MVHIAKAQMVFAEDGDVIAAADPAAWDDYMTRTFLQLHWWASAAAEQRGRLAIAKTTQATEKTTQAFTQTPSQRDAPPSK